jgi:hypothetical protein
MAVTGSYMAWRVKVSPLPLVSAYGAVVFHDLMPTFDNIEQRAQRVAEEEYERLGAVPADDNWDGDMGALAEAAEDEALSFYETFSSMKQSILNLFAVGLFHLLEQQLADLCHDGAFTVAPPDGTTLVREVSPWYLRHFYLDLRGLRSWNAIDELRLVANVVKHAEGNSAQQLRERRPELFRYPAFKNEPHIEMLNVAHVARPLAGDDLYVTPELLKEYLDAAVGILSEVESYFEEHRNEYYPTE